MEKRTADDHASGPLHEKTSASPWRKTGTDVIKRAHLLPSLARYGSARTVRERPSVLPVPARDAPDRLRDERVSLGARQLPLQRRDRLDELRRLECPVSPPNRHSLEDVGIHEPISHRPAGCGPELLALGVLKCTGPAPEAPASSAAPPARFVVLLAVALFLELIALPIMSVFIDILRRIQEH